MKLLLWWAEFLFLFPLLTMYTSYLHICFWLEISSCIQDLFQKTCSVRTGTFSCKKGSFLTSWQFLPKNNIQQIFSKYSAKKSWPGFISVLKHSFDLKLNTAWITIQTTILMTGEKNILLWSGGGKNFVEMLREIQGFTFVEVSSSYFSKSFELPWKSKHLFSHS